MKNNKRVIELLMYSLNNINTELAEDLLAKRENKTDDEYAEFLINELYKMKKGNTYDTEKQKVGKYGAGFRIVLGGFASIEQVKDILYDYKFPMNDISLEWYKKIDYKSLESIIEEVVIDGLLRGIGIYKSAKILKDRCSLSLKDCETIVCGETELFYSNRDYKQYKRLGFDKYRILSTLDDRNCGKCGNLDLEVFYVSEAKVGVNFPPFHPSCRCTTIAYTEELPEVRRARDENRRSILVRGDMNYKEWKKIYLK